MEVRQGGSVTNGATRLVILLVYDIFCHILGGTIMFNFTGLCIIRKHFATLTATIEHFL